MKTGKHCFKVMLGSTPSKPQSCDISEEAAAIHKDKKENLDIAEATSLREEYAKTKPNKWLKRRWITLISINLLFVVSFALDIQVLEGALTASRFLGFHMADLNSALQVTLAFKTVLINLIIGTVTVFIMWYLLGGRTFCSWVCPYHLIAELAEMLHLKLVDKKIIKNHTFDRRARLWFYIIFAALALFTGYTVYEVISPTGILSRAIIYGPTVALLWVLSLLVFEVLYSRRAWCKYMCPIGLTYGFVGAISPFKVNYNMRECHHDGACRKVCLVPHVLDWTIKGRSPDVNVELGPDCTRCGLCIDVCPTDSLSYHFKGLHKKPE